MTDVKIIYLLLFYYIFIYYIYIIYLFIIYYYYYVRNVDVSVKIWSSSVHKDDNKELQTSLLIKNAKSLVKETLIFSIKMTKKEVHNIKKIIASQ